MQTLEQARSVFRAIDNAQFKGRITDLIVADPRSSVRPQAFLVEQAPNWVLPTHFHLQHQFQLFVGGGGSLGKHPIGPLTVHYASRHSGYGPLVSGDEGISYLTMRAVSDTGAWYLPESRDRLQLRIKKQQAHGAPDKLVTAHELRALPGPCQETLLAPDGDGLAAWLLRLPPRTRAPAPGADAKHAGRFYAFTKGSLRTGEHEIPALAALFVPPGETLDMEAGDAGLEVIVLQYPQSALVPED
jgi:hypothetical protein